ncbi:MAG TPA: HPr-rel-A system PqqD family peptide chaperone [Gaiellaceae bacterium]
MTGTTGRITRRADVTLTRTGGEALLVDERGGSVHVVNGTAARLWELCERSPTIEELAESLATSYELMETDVRRDVEKMVETLEGLGLLEKGTA